MPTTRVFLFLGLLTSLLSAGCSRRVDAGADPPAKPAGGGARPVSAPDCAECPRLFIEVGVVTMTGTPWALEENYQRLEVYLAEAARRRAALVIAPEGVLDGYVCAADPAVTKEKMLAIAQTVPDGPYLKRAAKLCRQLGIYLVFGFLEKAGDELFNSCVLFSPEGELLARYSKVHPTLESFITPGRELKTFDTPLGRLGFLICSDRGIVDNFSTLGAQGAEIILVPMNGGGGPRNTAVLRQRARDNYCSIIVANTWSCAIIGPDGEPTLEKYESECVSVGRLFLYSIPKGDQRHTFLERRPDLYAPLTKPSPANSHFDDKGRPTQREEEKRAGWRKELRNYKEKESLKR